jgi:hypothetical protein
MGGTPPDQLRVPTFEISQLLPISCESNRHIREMPFPDTGVIIPWRGSI